MIPPHPYKIGNTIGPSVINKLSADQTTIRNNFAVKEIIKGLEKYNKVFAIMGSTHSVIQESAYRDYFKSL